MLSLCKKKKIVVMFEGFVIEWKKVMLNARKIMGEVEKNIFSKVGNFFVVPSVVAAKLSVANATELKVALYFCAHPNASAMDAAGFLSLQKKEVDEALSFWRGAESTQPDTKPAALGKIGDAPEYDGKTLAKIVGSDAGFAAILDECQRLLQKTFTSHDTEVYVGCLYDFLGLSPEYILELTSFCCGNGKRNVRYIEKTAFSLCEEGIDDIAKLEAYIKNAEKNTKKEYRLRKLFGFGERALTASEKKIFAKLYDVPFELCEEAYEQMIKNIGEVKLNYLMKIIENWNEKGIKTKDDAIKESSGKEKKIKSPDSFSTKSFEFDDFLNAAIKNGTKKKGQDKNGNE